jgi:hypothetical protein
MLLTASSRSFEWLLHVGTDIYYIYEQEQKEESIKELIRSAKCKSANFWKIRWHGVSQYQQGMERKFLQIPQGTLFLNQNKRRLSKYSL